MKTKKLISNLKKGIEKLESVKLSKVYNKQGKPNYFGKDYKRIKQKQAQLQFAEKLIEAIKGDIEDLKDQIKYPPDLEFAEELNKILDEAIGR